MNISSISLIAQLQDGSSRPATADEIIAAARDHMSRRVRPAGLYSVVTIRSSRPHSDSTSFLSETEIL
jgi:hypothetical protein